MKTLLVPFRDSDAAEATAAATALVAKDFGSYIEGLYVRRTAQVIAAEGFVLPPDSLVQLADEGQRMAEDARRFNGLMSDHGIPFHDIAYASETATVGWRETEGQESQIVGDYGRLFDLIILGRPSNHAGTGWSAACEAAFFEAGRPVLVVPTAVPETLGKRVVIAWNGSTETARTIGLSMPILTRARSILVLTVEGGTVPGPSGDQVAAHLARHGLAVETKFVSEGNRSVGEVMMEEALAAGADLLVKGAFTRSRIRQMIFGGPTQHLLSSATLPVLFAH